MSDRQDEGLCGGRPMPSRRGWREVVAICREPNHLRTTLVLSLIVGTILFAINQLDVVLSGRAGPGTGAKILLTYLVPFAVSNFGIVHATGPRPAAPPAGEASGPAAVCRASEHPGEPAPH